MGTGNHHPPPASLPPEARALLWMNSGVQMLCGEAAVGTGAYHASTSVSQVDCPASGERYSKETPVPPARKSAAQVVSVRPSDWPRKEAVVTGMPLGPPG